MKAFDSIHLEFLIHCIDPAVESMSSRLLGAAIHQVSRGCLRVSEEDCLALPHLNQLGKTRFLSQSALHIRHHIAGITVTDKYHDHPSVKAVLDCQSVIAISIN
jgi:hypothetical protein